MCNIVYDGECKANLVGSVGCAMIKELEEGRLELASARLTKSELRLLNNPRSPQTSAKRIFKSTCIFVNFGTSICKRLRFAETYQEPPTPLLKMAAQPTLPQLTKALATIGLPTPHSAFLASILTPPASQRLPPLQALTATAKLRLLSSDLTSPQILSPTTPTFPLNISDAKIVSRVLQNDVPVQVLEIEDMSKSKWEQIEALEMERKGEMTKGREVIRVVADPDAAPTQARASSGASTATTRSYGPYKLLMQDINGGKVHGFELKRIEKIGYPPTMSIGCKMVLKKGCTVARGMVLLEPGSVVVLGGKIEGLDKGWREGREKALREMVGEGREGAEVD